MKNKIISINSSRGGTGKTVVATSMAVILARKGFNVALLDMDFRSPSLYYVFYRDGKPLVECWLNDLLYNRCDKSKVLTDVAVGRNLKGTLQVGFANPSLAAIHGIMRKSGGWEVNSAKNIFSFISYLKKELNIDYCIFDTSPGVQYSSVNAIAASDLCILITSPDLVDLAGTDVLINDIARPLSKKIFLILNKTQTENNETLPRKFGQKQTTLNYPISATIPCYCDVLHAHRDGFFALQKPDHPFVRKLEGVLEKIDAPELIH